jgi:hypothetical protein
MRPYGNQWPKDVVVSIELPIAKSVCESFSIEFKGFVARARGTTLTRPRRLKFLVGSRQLRTCQINLPRPDAIAPGARRPIEVGDVDCGFSTVLPSFLSRREEPIEIRVQHDPDKMGNSLEYRLASIRFRAYGRRRKQAKFDDIGLISVNSIGRSGSSLLCRVLDLHPACVAPKLEGQYGEVFVVGHYLRAIGVLSSEGALAEMNKFDLGDFLNLSVGYLRTDFRESGHEAELYKRIMGETRKQSIKLLGSVLHEVAKYARSAKPEAQYWVEKTWNWSSTNIAPSLIKNFREIIVLRHIRDFWRSQKLYQQKIRSTQEQVRLHADGTYHKYILLAEACCDRRPDILVIRYEDLIADARGQFRHVFQYLGVSYDDQLVEQVGRITQGDDAHRSLVTSSDSENTQPDDFDDYLALLTESERSYLGSLLTELGYSL